MFLDTSGLGDFEAPIDDPPTLALMDADFLAASLRPANPDHAYTVEAALLKMADFMDTMWIGLHHPQRMTRGGWSQSGKRIALQLYKESIILPLLRRLAGEHRSLEQRSGLRIGALLAAFGRRSSDYARSNLAIACEERGVVDSRAFERDYLDPAITNTSLAGKWEPRFGEVRPPFDAAMAVPLRRLLEEYRGRVLEIRTLTAGLGSA